MTSRFKQILKKLTGHDNARELISLLANSTSIAANGFVSKLLATPRYSDSRRLNHFERQVFSQNGEDGIIAEIFRRIGTTNRVFLEFGAGEGLENNTCYLLFQGWTGFWFDGGAVEVARIQEHFREPIQAGRLRVKEAFITAENINEILQKAQIPSELDIFSLDIDRNTSHIWSAIETIRPRVIVVEYNATFPPELDWEVPYVADRAWNRSHYFGATLLAMERIGRTKGYSLVGCDLTGTNAFFVRNDLVEGSFSGPFTAAEFYEPPRYFLSRREAHCRAFDDSPV
jgi:hypothetical protein